MTRHIVIKLSKSKDKGRIFEAPRKEQKNDRVGRQGKTSSNIHNEEATNPKNDLKTAEQIVYTR